MHLELWAENESSSDQLESRIHVVIIFCKRKSGWLLVYDFSSELVGEHQASPYKELDDFVLKLVKRDGVEGSKHEQKELCMIT